MIITLCGSTKFKDMYEEAMKRFTLDGHIVLTCGFFQHAGDGKLTTAQKVKLDQLHLEKIDMSDLIFVINVGGYIGESTRNEIKYAEKMGKLVNYLEK